MSSVTITNFRALPITAHNVHWNMSRKKRDSQLVSVFISGIGSSEQNRFNDVQAIKMLDLPIQSLPIDEFCLGGIPIRGYRDAVPKMLIGVDNLRVSLPLKSREGVHGRYNPIAVTTHLGWCICVDRIMFNRNYVSS